MPSHHLFGLNELVETFSDDCSSANIKKDYGGGRIDFLYVNFTISDALKVYYKSFYYDSLNVVTKYLSVLNRFHLFPSRLISIYHHPPFNKYLSYGKADISVFFTESLYEIACKCVSDDRKMLFNMWYLENKWYDDNANCEEEKVFDFINNGKTCRDHGIFVQALIRLKKSGIIVCSEKQKVELSHDNSLLSIFCPKVPNDMDVLKYNSRSKIMVIPILDNRPIIGPIGYTSYMDAIALGMPIVTNENAAMAHEIKNNNLGVLYKSLDVDSLVNAMEKTLKHYDYYHQNMLNFKETHDLKQYSEKIIPFIFK